MSMSQDSVFETALSLPPSQRADLAFQLLQSLDHPGEEVSDEEFAAELQSRVQAYERGEIQSYTLEETRAIIRDRLSTERKQ
jgi:putative addiction module component (TIGR02574 family)